MIFDLLPRSVSIWPPGVECKISEISDTINKMFNIYRIYRMDQFTAYNLFGIGFMSFLLMKWKGQVIFIFSCKENC